MRSYPQPELWALDREQVAILELALAGASERDVRRAVAAARLRAAGRRRYAARSLRRHLDAAHADLYGWRERD